MIIEILFFIWILCLGYYLRYFIEYVEDPAVSLNKRSYFIALFLVVVFCPLAAIIDFYCHLRGYLK